jgi:hypothetical protein
LLSVCWTLGLGLPASFTTWVNPLLWILTLVIVAKINVYGFWSNENCSLTNGMRVTGLEFETHPTHVKGEIVGHWSNWNHSPRVSTSHFQILYLTFIPRSAWVGSHILLLHLDLYALILIFTIPYFSCHEVLSFTWVGSHILLPHLGLYVLIHAMRC